MTTTIDTGHDGRLQISVEAWHLPGASAQDSDSGYPAQFDLASAATVVGPGEDCLVCDEPLVAGEVFVLGTWDGRSGPAHEDCPLLLVALLANMVEQADDEQARHVATPLVEKGGPAR
jgi:hypothetical protein